MNLMRIWLVRHGQTAWNKAHRAQGHTDIPLDEVGKQQALLVGRAMAELPIERVVSSDLSRALDTGKQIAEAANISISVDDRLRERSFGEWEGEDFPTIAERFPKMADEQGVSRNHVRPPGGESFADVYARLQEFTEELISRNENTVIATHGGTCSVLLSILLGGGLELSNSFRFSNAAITEVETHWNGKFRLLTYNDVAHLKASGPDLPVLTGTADGSAR